MTINNVCIECQLRLMRLIKYTDQVYKPTAWRSIGLRVPITRNTTNMAAEVLLSTEHMFGPLEGSISKQI